MIKYLRNLRENVCLQAAFWLNLSELFIQMYYFFALHFEWQPPKFLLSENIDLGNFLFIAPLVALLLCFLSLFEFLIRKFFMKQRTIEEPKDPLLKKLDKIYTVIFSIATFISFLILAFLILLFSTL